MKVITYVELNEVLENFNNWAIRDVFITKLFENQNELIDKVEELERRLAFLEPSKEE